jgi:hypothetical protein
MLSLATVSERPVPTSTPYFILATVPHTYLTRRRPNAPSVHNPLHRTCSNAQPVERGNRPLNYPYSYEDRPVLPVQYQMILRQCEEDVHLPLLVGAR